MDKSQGENLTISHFTPGLTDMVYRTGTDAQPRESPHAEHASPLARSDVSWDAFEQSPLGIKAKSSLLSFSDIASNTDSGYWTENECTGSLACSYPTFTGTLPEDGLSTPGVDNAALAARQQLQSSSAFNTADLGFSTWPTTEAEGITLPQQDSPTLLDETPHDTYTALLTESSAEILLEPSAHQSEEALSCSDDPFMGSWDSEKAHHLFDDYGWVLHHVENL
jgi:hypothetical protein